MSDDPGASVTQIRSAFTRAGSFAPAHGFAPSALPHYYPAAAAVARIAVAFAPDLVELLPGAEYSIDSKLRAVERITQVELD